MGDSMPDDRFARVGCALLLTSLALAGCTSEVSAGDPTTKPAPEAPAALEGSTASARATVTETTSETREADVAKRCSPLECCFPDQGGGWQDTPLEDDLRALGCTTPSPYAMTGDHLWVWTRCAWSFGVFEAAFKYAGTPYDTRFVENPCLKPVPDKLDVVFDPTCGTCVVTLD
jgi:hypothetical protein